ncbi:hypothetical protein EDD21DRAFT_382037 [Dissophora ornata]|nr:hypothetical protein EDD21DRAFT_382037 [Dissophora ornata]
MFIPFFGIHPSAPTTTFEEAVLEGSASESELNQSLQARPPKRARGCPKKCLNAWVEQEFSALMKVLSTLRNAHAVVENEDHQNQGSCSSAAHAHELHQRATMFRLHENENLARRTKEAYSTYLKLFRDFCDRIYVFEKDSRYEVYEEKVLVFFKDVMFTRRIPKVFKVNDTRDVRVALALATPDSKASRRPVDLRKLLETVPQDKDGSKVLQVPCESATMDQALKAIVYLQTRQSNRIVNPNKAPHLRKSTAVKETLSKYDNDLVIGELVNHRNWSASCAVRNTNTMDEHVLEIASRIESKLDYVISRLGHSASGSAGSLWQPHPAPSCSCQHAFGFTPPLAAPTALQVQSEQTDPSRRLAQAPVTALEPPRWTPIAQAQLQPQPQRMPLQAVPVRQQSSLATGTTATTTTNVTTGGVTINYKLGNVAAIWEEHQKFEQERQKAGKKSLGIPRKHQKQLNNKRQVVEEVELWPIKSDQKMSALVKRMPSKRLCQSSTQCSRCIHGLLTS